MMEVYHGSNVIVNKPKIITNYICLFDYLFISP